MPQSIVHKSKIFRL